MIPFARGIWYQGKFGNELGHKGAVGSNPPKRSGGLQRFWGEYRYSTARRENAKASDYRSS